MTKRLIHVSKNMEEMSREAAELFAAETEAAVRSSGLFNVAISGGSTPTCFYAMLAMDEYRTRIDWRRVHFFWADERCVPPDHPDSNFRLAFDLLLSKVPVPEDNIHRVHGELAPQAAADLYDRDLRNFCGGTAAPRFDLICLGVGNDGHTASLFPGENADGNLLRAAVPVIAEKTGHRRVSLTISVLNNAKTVVFLVSGKSKSQVVRDIVTGTKPDLPAAKVDPPEGRTIWLLDLEAAELLDN